ncbi:hypothetical protein LEN26_010414 [Aphanomyces euteiches]|nr:hypothetical protein AeMF1_009968 [Aphanomyces euteiches]KAH9122079.1 hypothetical protein LEN26_010414 [Aphanomyces euteiches]KAH9196564.1 hypothetical protein AeNC1_001463 [Aphanomyces euteiches]
MREGSTAIKSILEEDAQIVSEIKKELQEIQVLIDGKEQDTIRPSSPVVSTPLADQSDKKQWIRKRWKATVRQIVFMEKTKDKVQEAYENESVARLRNMSPLSLLCSVPIFQSLHRAALMDLNSHVHVKSYAPNATLFSQRIDSQYIFIVRSGTAWVKAPGRERVPGEFHQDDVICESGDVIDPTDFLEQDDLYKCLALGTVEALLLPREVLEKYKGQLSRFSDTLHSVRYTDKASECFRKWAARTAGCLRYEPTTASSDGHTPQAFIREILLSISPELDLDHCIQCMARLFQRVFLADIVRLHLVNIRATQFLTKFATDVESQGAQMPISVGLPGLIYGSQKPITFCPSTTEPLQNLDWNLYSSHRSVMAVPVFQPKTMDEVAAVWELISDATTYASHELHLLEMAATFMQPYLGQVDRPSKRMGSITQVEASFVLTPRKLRVLSKTKSIYVTAGLYHGGDLLVPVVKTPLLRCTERGPMKTFAFAAPIQFACNVQSLPRAVHMTWRVHSAKQEGRIVAETSCFLFSHDHFFRTGTISLSLLLRVELPIEFDACILPPSHTCESYLMVDLPKYQYPLTYRGNDIPVTLSARVNDNLHNDWSQLRAFEKDPLRPLTSQDKAFFWQLREVLTTTPAALMPFLLSVDWSNRVHATEAYKYLYLWSAPTYLQALQLLNRKFPDPFVRAYAVRCLDSLPDYRLRLYLVQLVQALKNEQHHDSALMRFLFVRALKSPSEVGYALFWLLQAELHVPSVRGRFQLLCTQYLCHCGSYRLELYQSMYVMRLLEGVAKHIKDQNTKASACHEILRELLQDAIVPECFQLPLHPNVFYKAFEPEKCRVMDSAKKPLFLYLTPMKPHPQPLGNKTSETPQVLDSVIFKCGDDLRQDQLTLQLLRVMDDLWHTAGLDLRLSAYACVSTGDNIGFIQVVHHASTLASICRDRHRQKKRFQKLAAVKTAMWGKTVLANWLQDKAGVANIDEVVANFVLSSAGYCVATYVLGIGDRHNDNIMLTETGQFLHIDFGHFLGHYKTYLGYKRERAPFVLTPAMVYVMGDEFPKFQALCVQAFLILRANAALLITLLQLALSAGIPELTADTIPWLHSTLLLDLSDDVAQARFEALIQQALATVTTRINHATHILAH